MSNSQWKNWLRCPSAAKAQMEGKYKPETTDAMLIGSFVDAALTTPELFEKWKADHADDINDKRSKTPKLTAKFEGAVAMIDRVKSDPVFKQIATKAKGQVVLRGQIMGREWLYMADWIMDAKTGPILLDLKTAADFDDKWVEINGRNAKVPWYDAFGYWRQLAVGRELYHQNHGIYPACGIVAVTKQDPPALGVWVMEDVPRLEAEILRIEELNGLVMSYKDGLIPTTECGECPWCRKQSNLGIERLAISARIYTE